MPHLSVAHEVELCFVHMSVESWVVRVSKGGGLGGIGVGGR